MGPTDSLEDSALLGRSFGRSFEVEILRVNGRVVGCLLRIECFGESPLILPTHIFFSGIRLINGSERDSNEGPPWILWSPESWEILKKESPSLCLCAYELWEYTSTPSKEGLTVKQCFLCFSSPFLCLTHKAEILLFFYRFCSGLKKTDRKPDAKKSRRKEYRRKQKYCRHQRYRKYQEEKNTEEIKKIK